MKKETNNNKVIFANKPAQVEISHRYNILLVGGCSDNLKKSCQALQELHTDAVFATTSIKAMDILFNNPVDLVVISSGFTSTIMKIRTMSSVPCICILSPRAMKIGGCDFTLRVEDYGYGMPSYQKLLIVIDDQVKQFSFSGAVRCSKTYINMDSYTAVINGKIMLLKPMEMKVLFYLMKHRNRVIRREDFSNAVWGYNAGTNTRTLDVHMMDLRRKLKNADTGFIITTLRSVGFRLTETTIADKFNLGVE